MQLAGTGPWAYVRRAPHPHPQDRMLTQVYVHLFVAVAGLVSFLSPCVLPLVPPYLGYLGGTTIEELGRKDEIDMAMWRRVVLASLFFVLGFTTVFVGLGATASLFGQWIQAHRSELAIAAGIVIILFGLHFLGVLRVPLLYREARFHAATQGAGLAGAYLMGLAFAFGWTPCIGPVLASVLAVAANEASLGAGVRLLLVYSLGLGIPFVLAAVAIGPFLGFLKRFRRHLGRVEKAMGLLLVLAGILILAGPVREWLLARDPALLQMGWLAKLLMTAVGFALLAGASGWISRELGKELPTRIETVVQLMGLLLLVLGVSLLGGSLNDLGTWMVQNVPVLGSIEEFITPKHLDSEILKERPQ
jgi:cytochrome c-type biogenesis protein